MTRNATLRVLVGLCTLLTVFALVAVTAIAQTSTTTTKTKGTATVTTREESGTVIFVEGNTVVIKGNNGEIKTFEVDPSRTANVDGRDITVRDLKVGTTLKATYTTTTTPVTERTVTVASGTVWFVSGRSVIATIDGKNHQFTPRPDQKFKVGGQMVDITGLRKGMTFSAEKIVESPLVEVATNKVITGTAPKPKPVVAETPAPRPAPVREAAAAPPPTRAAAPEPAPAPAPAKLPKTGSPLPLIGLLGILSTGASLVLRTIRRFQ